jgi:hypothetical protein
MTSLPKNRWAPRARRRTTIRVTGADGVTWEGNGVGSALAVRDLDQRHRAACLGSDPSGERSETPWTLTAKGWAAVAQACQPVEGQP